MQGLGVRSVVNLLLQVVPQRAVGQMLGWDVTTPVATRRSAPTVVTSLKRTKVQKNTVFLMNMATVAVRTAVDFYAEYDNKWLRLFLYSRELPPFIAVGGARAAAMAKILRNKFNSFSYDGVEAVKIAPLYVPAVLVWTAASIASKPSADLLEALMGSTPKSAVDLLFELVDARNSYREGKPLIPFRKLYKASKIIVEILKLQNYPVDA